MRILHDTAKTDIRQDLIRYKLWFIEEVGIKYMKSWERERELLEEGRREEREKYEAERKEERKKYEAERRRADEAEKRANLIDEKLARYIAKYGDII